VALRTAHGKGTAALVRAETLPVDELPDGTQGPQEAEAPHERRSNGQFAKGATTNQRKGGKAQVQRTRLANRLGLASLDQGAAFAPYRRAGAAFAKAQRRFLRQNIAGGELGPASASMVSGAALALAAAQYLFDQGGATGDPALLIQAARLADQSRQALLTAHELAAREGAAASKRRKLEREAEAMAKQAAEWRRMLGEDG
jgi:hypothetical protein